MPENSAICATLGQRFRNFLRKPLPDFGICRGVIFLVCFALTHLELRQFNTRVISWLDRKEIGGVWSFLWRDAKIDKYQRACRTVCGCIQKDSREFFSNLGDISYDMIDAVLVSCAVDFFFRSLVSQSGLQQHSQNWWPSNLKDN